MALTFQVGSTGQVIREPAASKLARQLEQLYPGSGAGNSERDLWHSSELGWSGWGSLQDRVQMELGPGGAPHFLSMEAWYGAYLPLKLEPGAVAVDESGTPLSVASLPFLIQELEQFAAAVGLPVDPAGLRRLAATYDDDDLCDDDMDLQTYAQLLQGALIAMERQQPLWIIK